jgi:tryptophan synthase alpha chain
MSSSTKTTNRYQQTFESLKKENKTALIPFTLLGWPNAEISFEVIKAMIDSGASALELGFAFSDPMADGPVIQAACTEVLKTDFDVAHGIDLLQKIRSYHSDVPIGLLVYYNMVMAYGIQSWFETLAKIGVDACMIVDLPLESIDEIQQAAKIHGVSLVLMVSPLTSPSRIAEIANKDPAFLYVVSRLGITGTHTQYDEQLQSLLNTIHTATPIPACVGFGISKPEHVSRMKSLGADGVIIGSAIIQVVRDAQEKGMKPYDAIKCYLTPLLDACR